MAAASLREQRTIEDGARPSVVRLRLATRRASVLGHLTVGIGKQTVTLTMTTQDNASHLQLQAFNFHCKASVAVEAC